MIKEGNVRIAVTLSSNTNDAIRVCCKQIGCSVSDLIQDLLNEFLIEFNELSYKLDAKEDRTNDKLSKISNLVEGTIDHFDLDDAMDLLYQIKDVLEAKGDSDANSD